MLSCSVYTGTLVYMLTMLSCAVYTRYNSFVIFAHNVVMFGLDRVQQLCNLGLQCCHVRFTKGIIVWLNMLTMWLFSVYTGTSVLLFRLTMFCCLFTQVQ